MGLLGASLMLVSSRCCGFGRKRGRRCQDPTDKRKTGIAHPLSQGCSSLVVPSLLRPRDLLESRSRRAARVPLLNPCGLFVKSHDATSSRQGPQRPSLENVGSPQDEQGFVLAGGLSKLFDTSSVEPS